MLSEEQIKTLCKLAVEYGNRPFSREEKEALKQMIDKSRNLEELLSVVALSILLKGDS